MRAEGRPGRQRLAGRGQEARGRGLVATQLGTSVIHIVGGGSPNDLLNQMTAEACHKPVIAGPVEATAMGNLLTQVRASREIGSLAQMRDVVHASTPLKRYEPGPDARWSEARARLLDLLL